MANPKKAPPARAPSAARAPHEVRIIGGQWKRTKLPVVDLPGLRPTPDRVRETLFNWLGQDLSGWVCVDAFAGTGALGFEAASRGAAQVLLVEQRAALVPRLQALRERLQADAITVRRADGIGALSQCAPGSVDLVFIDPPFDANLWERALAPAARAVRPGAFVYLEAAEAWSAEQVAAHGLELWRHAKAGAVHAHLLRKPQPV